MTETSPNFNPIDPDLQYEIKNDETDVPNGEINISFSEEPKNLKIDSVFEIKESTITKIGSRDKPRKPINIKGSKVKSGKNKRGLRPKNDLAIEIPDSDRPTDAQTNFNRSKYSGIEVTELDMTEIKKGMPDTPPGLYEDFGGKNITDIDNPVDGENIMEEEDKEEYRKTELPLHVGIYNEEKNEAHEKTNNYFTQGSVGALRGDSCSVSEISVAINEGESVDVPAPITRQRINNRRRTIYIWIAIILFALLFFMWVFIIFFILDFTWDQSCHVLI